MKLSAFLSYIEAISKLSDYLAVPFNVFAYLQNFQSNILSIKLIVIFESQRHPPEGFCKKRCSKKFHKINRKTSAPEPKACNFNEKRLWYGCFPVNFAKFLRTSFLKEHLKWLLLERKLIIEFEWKPIKPKTWLIIILLMF